MKILIHTQGGSVGAFFQDNPALAARILKEIQPSRVFAGNVITIAGEYSLTSFVAARVNRVDLIAEDLPLWEQPTDILDMVELPEDDFQERSHVNDPARLERRRSPKRTGEFAVVYVEVEMTGGSRIFLAAEIQVAVEAERLQRLHMLFSAPAVHFRLLQGGISILNLKNLVRFTFNPGPDVTPMDAWPAHHLSLRQRSGGIADAMTGINPNC
ncbi:MAG: hypothetical protein ABSH38_10700 [Verrucomicrobiota bacterium]|jgi:hypothetical protein